MKTEPLVSILIPNYNHSRYLDISIQSALGQTYKNIEVILLDNQSEDNSIDVALKYQEQGLRVCRNAYNYVNFSYRILSEILAESRCKYMMLLPADDYIKETYVAKCVKIMEKHINVGYVHVERDFVTDDGGLIELDPFYTCNFIAQGKNVMPIYMMSTMAHAAQGIFRCTAFKEVYGYDSVVDHLNVDRTLWFYLSSVCDYAYLREKLVCIRMGANTETFITQTNFQHPILSYMSILEFIDFAERNGFDEVLERRECALDKYAREYLNHCAGAIAMGNIELAKKYMLFCKIISRAVENEEMYKRLLEMLETKEVDEEYLKAIHNNEFRRKRGYQPPKDYIPLELHLQQYAEGSYK